LNPKLYWIKSAFPGRLAISAPPRGGDWLEDEIVGWRGQGVDSVVSLLTASENEELDLKKELTLAGAKGIHFLSFPIEDRQVPKSIAKVETLLSQLIGELQNGKNVAIHCRQGIGRSSLVSAALLISAGEDFEQTLAAISKSRGVEVPETSEQRSWLQQFARAHASPSLSRLGR
jgi:protein-tyrosine phosphatase